MNPAPKWRELHEQGHNHLERAVQPEGQCPGCDAVIWQPQRLRIPRISSHMRAEDLSTDRKASARENHDTCDAAYMPPTGRGCRRAKCDHTCKRPAGHKGELHRCPTCNGAWKMPHTALVAVGA